MPVREKRQATGFRLDAGFHDRLRKAGDPSGIAATHRQKVESASAPLQVAERRDQVIAALGGPDLAVDTDRGQLPIDANGPAAGTPASAASVASSRSTSRGVASEWNTSCGSGVRNPDGALTVKIRYAVRRLAGVARPGSVGVARRSVGALRRVRDAGWPPGAGQSKRRDPAHVACGFRRIPPSWRFRRRERAVIAVAPSPALCRRHRSRLASSHQPRLRARRATSSKPLTEKREAVAGPMTSPWPRTRGNAPGLPLATTAQ